MSCAATQTSLYTSEIKVVKTNTPSENTSVITAGRLLGAGLMTASLSGVAARLPAAPGSLNFNSCGKQLKQGSFSRQKAGLEKMQ